MNWLRGGLQARLLSSVVIATLVFTSLACAVAYVYSERRAEAAATEIVSELESAMQRTASIALYAHDAALMQEVVHGIARNALARSVRLTDAQGRTLVRSDPSTPADAGVPARTVDTELPSPFDAAELLGRLRVDIDMGQVHAASAREARAFVLGMAGQSAVVALIIYLAAARLVSRPIVRIARQLGNMRPDEGAQLPMPPTHDADELGVFVRSINGLLRDSSLALQRERKLRSDIAAMEAQYRQIFDATSAGIFVLDWEGNLINGNPTLLRLTGHDVADVAHLRGRQFIDEVFARPDRFRDMIENAIWRGETVSADLELLSRDGLPRWSHCLVSVRQGPGAAQAGAAPVILEGVLYDITDRKRIESAVRLEADRDGLTRALSRAATERMLDRLVARGDTGAGFTLMYVDLDGFKNVNDTLGHAAGDAVLKALVERLFESRRDGDFVGRLGGDEFVVILTNTRPDTPVAALAADVLRRLCAPVALANGETVTLGASIGLAQFPRHGITREALLHAADEAMYAVKRHGKNAIASAIGGPAAS